MTALGEALSASQRASGTEYTPAAIQAAYDALEPAERGLLTERVTSTEPAEDLAALLTEAGYPVSATTIRVYRRALRRKASNV